MLTISSSVTPFSSCPQTRVFSNELALRIRWSDYWNFSFSLNPSSENSGFISFRIDWFDLLAVQGTLKSLLQHHNSKSSCQWILIHSSNLEKKTSYIYMRKINKFASHRLFAFLQKYSFKNYVKNVKVNFD